ncbi:hypothetical protein ACGFIW_01855 [Micromonospora sp. NPDC048935]|uniref:hypothetical protein n=1 Tax=Micromonospora sp. NPDC048935 TaxID=3364262 RepID=UPI0037206EE0
MTATATGQKPPVGARVRITETYADGTRITAEGPVTHHEPGVDRFVYIGALRHTMLWQAGRARRESPAADVQVTRLCDVCGKDSTTADGIVGAYVCDDYNCLLAAYDRAVGADAPAPVKVIDCTVLPQLAGDILRATADQVAPKKPVTR